MHRRLPAKHPDHPPPVIPLDEQCQMLTNYDSYDDYVMSMVTPFYYETWESVSDYVLHEWPFNMVMIYVI